MYDQPRAQKVTCKTKTVTRFCIPCQDFKSIILNQRIVDESGNHDGLGGRDDQNSEKELVELIGETIQEIAGTKPCTMEPPWISEVQMVNKIWSCQQALTTFILTFFLNQA